MKNDPFFIGWNGSLPEENKKSIQRLLILIFIFIPILSGILVFFTKPFTDHRFELGQVKEFTGIYFEEPFPAFILDQGQLPKNLNSNTLLVGYGKNGAKTFLKTKADTAGSLSGRHLKIQGTLIYGDGKTLIELTKKEESILTISSPTGISTDVPGSSQVTLRGEILDPKCWFGVMKPGEGKVHKSCAIRCISGGIPPVLRVESHGSNTYYILIDEQQRNINQEILAYVAEPVEVSGQAYFQNGWNILKINPDRINFLR